MAHSTLQTIICCGLLVLAAGALCFLGIGYLRGQSPPEVLVGLVATITGGLIGYLNQHPANVGAQRAETVNVETKE